MRWRMEKDREEEEKEWKRNCMDPCLTDGSLMKTMKVKMMKVKVSQSVTEQHESREGKRDVRNGVRQSQERKTNRRRDRRRRERLAVPAAADVTGNSARWLVETFYFRKQYDSNPASCFIHSSYVSEEVSNKQFISNQILLLSFQLTTSRRSRSNIKMIHFIFRHWDKLFGVF